MAGLNDNFLLADDSMEPKKEPEVTVDVFKDIQTEDGVPEIRDDVDLIAVGTEEFSIRLRDLQLLEEQIRDQGGMNKSIALEAHALMPEFISDERPVEFFTKAPSRTLLSAALEDIDSEKKNTLAKFIESLQAMIKNMIDRANAFFKAREDSNLSNFSEQTQQPKPAAISWTKAAKDSGVEVAAAKEGEAAPTPEQREQALQEDDNRKKVIEQLGDKLFVKLGAPALKQMAFVGGPQSKMPTAFIDFVMSNLERARRDIDPAHIRDLAGDAAKLVGDFRQEEASFEGPAGLQIAREIIGDVLYYTDHHYFKDHYKFKNAAASFKSSFLDLLSRLSAKIAQMRNMASKEEVADLHLYQVAMGSLNQLFRVHQEVTSSVDTFLKIRQHYFVPKAA